MSNGYLINYVEIFLVVLTETSTRFTSHFLQRLTRQSPWCRCVIDS